VNYNALRFNRHFLQLNLG